LKKLTLTISAAYLLLVNAAFAEPYTVYVAPNGDDSWSGGLPAPNASASDGPVASLTQAAALVGTQRAYEGLEEGATIYVRRGTYYLDETIALGESDSGSPGRPIVWQPFGDERVRLVGGKPLDAWEVHSGSVRRADTRDLAKTDAEFKQLFFNGKRMDLARWPNRGDNDLPGGGWAHVDFAVDDGTRQSFGFNDERLATWKRPHDVQVSIFPNYNWWHGLFDVGAIDPKTRVITLTEAAPHGIEPGRRFFVQNVFEELDYPGEWWLDWDTGALYFAPPTPIQPGAVIIPTVSSIFHLDGAENVTIRGFTMEATIGTAVVVENSRSVLVVANTIRNTGADGIRILGGADNRVVGNDLNDLGRSGIILQGGNRKALTPANHVAMNNHIHTYARVARTFKPGIYLNGVGLRAAHNRIHNAPHMAIYLGAANDCVVEYNEIFDVCLETDDAGAIYMGRDWTTRGNVIRFNKVHDVYGFGLVTEQRDTEGVYRYQIPAKAHAVYLDDAASGMLITGNLFYRVPEKAVMIGGGRDNRVLNNLFFDCSPAFHIDARWPDFDWAGLQEKVRAIGYNRPPWNERYPELQDLLTGTDHRKPQNNRFARNIVTFSRGRVRGSAMPNYAYHLTQFDMATTTIDQNLVYSPDGQPLVHYSEAQGDTLSWAQWQNLGFDSNSTNASPRLSDPGRDDFRLRVGSAATQLGWESIPYERIGLYKDPYRATWPVRSPRAGRTMPSNTWNVRVRTNSAENNLLGPGR
jgi:hypothetical protein